MFDIQAQRAREAKIAKVYAREEKAAAVVNFAPFFHNLMFTYKESFMDFEKMEQECLNIIKIIEQTDSDLPAFIHTFCSIGMSAEAFGCELVMPEDKFPWTLHAVHDIEDVYKLKPKKISELSYYGQMRKWVDYAQRKLGVELPFWSLDIQSPFSVADQIVDTEELLIACYDNPKAVHHLLEMITEVTIQMHDDHMKQMERAGYPGRNFPSISQNIGLCLSDDTPLIMLSPDMYREFALPYANILSKHFNGLHVHSCGAYMNNMDSILEIENVKSVQLHGGPGEYVLSEIANEDSPFARAASSVAMNIDTNPICRGDKWSDKPMEFYDEYLIPRLKANTPSWLMLDVPVPAGNPEMYSAYSQKTREYLKELNF